MGQPEVPPTVHLEREIAEQPEALRRILGDERQASRDWADRIRSHADVTTLLFAARGSSDNAARYGQYVFGAYNRLPVALATSSLYSRYARPPRLDGVAVVAVSQSGRSPDVVSVVAEGNAQGRPTAAVTNDPDSDLAVAAETVIALHAGDERSVAATKTYVTSLAAMALMSVALENPADDDRARALGAVPDAVARTVAAAVADLTVPSWLADAPACAVIGRGFNYGTAFEIALKLKELTGIIAQPYSSADFLHGPVAAVQPGFPVVLVAPSGVVHGDVADLLEPLRARGAKLLVVSDDQDLLAQADCAMTLPEAVSEWLSPLVAVVPGQVLAWRLAARRGRDIDRPAGLRKVTETR